MVVGWGLEAGRESSGVKADAKESSGGEVVMATLRRGHIKSRDATPNMTSTA